MLGKIKGIRSFYFGANTGVGAALVLFIDLFIYVTDKSKTYRFFRTKTIDKTVWTKY